MPRCKTARYPKLGYTHNGWLIVERYAEGYRLLQKGVVWRVSGRNETVRFRSRPDAERYIYHALIALGYSWFLERRSVR